MTTAPIKDFDAVLRFARTDRDGISSTYECVVRFPCFADFEAAEDTAHRIAYAIVEGLPKTEDNNAYGWKMDREAVGTITEV